MGAWLARRLGQAVVAAWLIASAVFLVDRLSGPPPEQYLLEQLEEQPAYSNAGQAAMRQAMRHRLGFDQPLFYVGRADDGHWQWRGVPNQYHTWMQELLHSRLGYSYRDGQPVQSQLAPALTYTLPLVGLAMLLSTTLALVLAMHLAAQRPGHTALLALLTTLHTLPLFMLGLGLLLLLANPAFLNIMPAADLSGYPPDLGSWAWLADYLPRLVLPVACLTLGALPELTLPLAASLRTELRSSYATAARAKGLSKRQLLWHHALPNAVLPLLSTLAGLLPTLVAGAVVVEVLFALPGTGRLLADAAATRDYPMLEAGVLLTAAARLLALLLADAAQYLLDPRLRAAPLPQ